MDWYKIGERIGYLMIGSIFVACWALTIMGCVALGVLLWKAVFIGG